MLNESVAMDCFKDLVLSAIKRHSIAKPKVTGIRQGQQISTLIKVDGSFKPHLFTQPRKPSWFFLSLFFLGSTLFGGI